MRALLALAAAPRAAAARAQEAGWGNLNKERRGQGLLLDPAALQRLLDGLDPGDAGLLRSSSSARIALMGLLEWRSPGGAPRHGILGLDTTRGDRLFISLLGSAYIFLGWLAFLTPPLWGPLALALLWTAFVFWKV